LTVLETNIVRFFKMFSKPTFGSRHHIIFLSCLPGVFATILTRTGDDLRLPMTCIGARTTDAPTVP